MCLFVPQWCSAPTTNVTSASSPFGSLCSRSSSLILADIEAPAPKVTSELPRMANGRKWKMGTHGSGAILLRIRKR
jgi:hypothetical protein